MALMTLASARSAIETTKGTPVTATRLLYFKQGAHEQTVGSISPDELRNSYFTTFRTYQGMERNAFKFSGDATYDDLAFWLRLAVKGGTAVVGTGATADKTWTFTPSASTDDLDSATIEFAYTDLLSNVGWKVPGVQVDNFSLKWEQGKQVTWSADLLTFKGATQITAFTGSLTDRTNVTALGTNTQVSVDTTTIGSTADPNVMSVEWDLKNGLVPLEALNNTNTGVALYRPKPREWELKVRRYFANKTELDTYIAKTERKVRTKSVGPALGSSNYSFQLDTYVTWDSMKVADASGLIVADFVGKPLFDSGASTDFGITLVNSQATMT